MQNYGYPYFAPRPNHCPSCGRCQHCGSGGHDEYYGPVWVVPYWEYHPWISCDGDAYQSASFFVTSDPDGTTSSNTLTVFGADSGGK